MSTAAVQPPDRAAGSSAPPAVDRAHLLAAVAGDGALAAELVALYREQEPALVAAIAAAIAAADAAALRRAAHTLKGSLLTLGAHAAAAAAEVLERMGVGTSLPPDAPDAHVSLARELARAADALADVP